jgi:hypothetical protein
MAARNARFAHADFRSLSIVAWQAPLVLSQSARPPMKTAIVTIAIGAAYSARFRAHCFPGWSRYAQRHGFELVVIEEPLDQTPRATARSPAWQKCLVLRPDIAGRFDRVIWIDSDILINDRAPSVAEGVPFEKIGATDEHLFPSPQLRRQMFTALLQQAQANNTGLAKTWATYLDPADWHAAWGLPRSGRSIVQTGVMVLTPKHHRELLEHVYYSYEDHGGEPMNYEMRPMSFEIQKQGLLHVLDNRFNALLIFLIMQRQMEMRRALLPDECAALVRLVFDQAYFLHLAGLKDSVNEFLPHLTRSQS